MKTLPVASIRPNPDQPRKRFDADALAELAKSIKLNGLLQPISVRPVASKKGQPGHYQIIAGERRWRAHQLAGIERIAVIVVNVGVSERDILAIVENLQRADITPLEEAHAYQRVVDGGVSAEDLANRLGCKTARVTDRMALLKMKPEYIDLMAKGHLSLSQANELASLAPHDQETLFRMIRDGRCETPSKLRAAAAALRDTATQGGFFEEEKKVTPQEKAALTAFEAKMEQVVRLVTEGFEDGEIVALKKINPHRAEIVSGQIELIIRHLKLIQRDIEQVAAQGEIVVEALPG